MLNGGILILVFFITEKETFEYYVFTEQNLYTGCDVQSFSYTHNTRVSHFILFFILYFIRDMAFAVLLIYQKNINVNKKK